MQASAVFHPVLEAQIRLCRYLVYLYAVGAYCYWAYIDMVPLSEGLAGLCLLPALIHVAYPTRRKWVGAAHCAEAICLPGLLLGMHADPGLLLAVLVVVLICNALLFGLLSWPVLVSTVALIGISIGLGDRFMSASISSMAWRVPASHLCFMLLFVLLIVSVAHRRAANLLRHEHNLRRQNDHLRRYLPGDLAHLSTERHSERAWLTVLFVDICEFTQAVDRLPPETIAEVLNDFLSLVTHHVQQHGQVHKFLGDGVLCIYRAPHGRARAQTAQHAVDAASALLRDIHGTNQRWVEQGLLDRFALSIGIASGFCTIGDWGPKQRKDYTVIGGAVNLAHRLQDQAPAGAMFIDEQTSALTSLEHSELDQPIALKGLGATRVFAPLPG